MSNKIHSYEGEDVTVSYNVRRCIHAARCVEELPEVFDPEKRPWIDADAARPEAILAAISRCPSGALKMKRDGDDVPVESPQPASIRSERDGPLYLSGNMCVHFDEEDALEAERRLALCRCGLSRNKPFCDNSHRTGFQDAGELGRGGVRLDPDVDDSERLDLSLSKNGPLLITGPFVIANDGETETRRGTKAALCRCGASQNKPFCDGSHKNAGFTG